MTDTEHSKANESRPLRPPVPGASLSHESWKIFQIMAEFVAGFEQLSAIKPSVSFFGSARTKPDQPLYALTESIARELSDAGFSVVTGGGPGVMEAGNKGAYAGKSLSIGLNINLPLEQTANDYQDISIDFKHFFARKVMFVRYASAYVVMPGGYGTLDELMEILTLIQTGKSRPIPIVMVGRKFWKGLIDWFKNSLITEGTIDGPDLDLLRVVDTPDEVVTAIFDHYGKRSFDPSPEEQRLMMDL